MSFKKCLGVSSALVISLSSFGVAPAQAECPEGKTEVIVTTPSGTERTLCIPDQAVTGLENAAEHSDGTIIPSACPCWDREDIRYYLENKMLESCIYDVGTHLLTCVDFNKEVILEAKKIEYCENFVTQEMHILKTAEQWNACYGLLPID